MSEVDEVALARAAAAVYAATPEDFLPTRNALVRDAKTGGDKALAAAIGKLRKPSVSAWALNLLAHEGDPVLDELKVLGGRMRSATSRLDVAELAGLRPERDRVLATLVESAVGIVVDAGRVLSAGGRDEVRDTGIAALADAEAQAAIESGTLVRTLSYSGFGEVDVADAVAVTSTGRVLGVIRGGGEGGPAPSRGGARDGRARDLDGDRYGDPGDEGPGDDNDPEEAGADESPGQESDPEAARAAAKHAAEQALEVAEAAVTEAGRALTQAQELLDAASDRRAAAQRQLDKATEAEARAQERVTAAKRARREAESARHSAEEALD